MLEREGRKRKNIPHPDEILHHELVESLGWVRHIYLSLAIPKICLSWCERQKLCDADTDTPSP